jgi:hypothetical protein
MKKLIDQTRDNKTRQDMDYIEWRSPILFDYWMFHVDICSRTPSSSLQGSNDQQDKNCSWIKPQDSVCYRSNTQQGRPETRHVLLIVNTAREY